MKATNDVDSRDLDAGPGLPAAPDLQGGAVSHDVTEYLRHLIMTGHFRPGDRLRVEHLAADLAISVTPVREALVELLCDGFVERRPRRGYVVARLTRSGFEDRVLVLAMVGGELAARAAARMNDDETEACAALERELSDLGKDADRDAAEAVNHRIHRAINLAARSPELAWTAERFSRYTPRYRGMPRNSRPRSCSYDHRDVLAALASHDAEAARDAMFEHLVEAGRLLGDELHARGLWTE
jgi:DNA-binding GntR family transcriptional regulator